MTPVFDITQTDGVEDAEQVGEAHEVPNPAAVLADTLTDQLERLGYHITEDDTAERAEVAGLDRVTVPAGRPVAELARALVIVTANKTSHSPSTTETT